MKDSPPRVGRVILAGLATLTASGVMSFAQGPPRAGFDNEPELTTREGHVALKWEGDHHGLVYEVDQARVADFSDAATLYVGPDTASFLSGLADGEYFFRVRAREVEGDTWGPWSESVALVCEHHSLTVAWTLFASGGLLFLLVVLFVGVNAHSLDRFERNNA